jgi:hypothetical protein
MKKWLTVDVKVKVDVAGCIRAFAYLLLIVVTL